MHLEYTSSFLGKSDQHRFLNFSMIVLVCMTLLTLIIAYFLNKSDVLHSEPVLSEAPKMHQDYQELTLLRDQLQEQLSAVKSQSDLDVNLIILKLFQNMALRLPQEVVLTELKCSEDGVLELRGQCTDVALLSTLLQEDLLTGWYYQGSHIDQREETNYIFQLEFYLKKPEILP